MYTMTQDIIEGLKLRVPFYDRYVLAQKEEKEKNAECIIDRVYIHQSYHVFTLILRDSTPETFASNLLNPDKWIDPSRQAVKKRKSSFKKNDIHQMDIENHRTEAAIRGVNKQTIRKALKEAHEILFETEFEDLPLVSHIQGWQFLIEARYEIENLDTLKTKTKTLEEPPQDVTIKKGGEYD